jgi:hypothetical protein
MILIRGTLATGDMVRPVNGSYVHSIERTNDDIFITGD